MSETPFLYECEVAVLVTEQVTGLEGRDHPAPAGHPSRGGELPRLAAFPSFGGVAGEA
jgi:hypothetical protein